jgi:hypothetical protein
MFLCSERNTWDVGRTLEMLGEHLKSLRMIASDSQTFLVFSQHPVCFSQSTETWKSDFLKLKYLIFNFHNAFGLLKLSAVVH